jgi:hypothetical protein
VRSAGALDKIQLRGDICQREGRKARASLAFRARS